MQGIIGIRRETIDQTERRAPLTPAQVRQLIRIEKIQVIVEPSENRIYADDVYRQAGADVSEDLSGCNIIFGVKEVPLSDLLPGLAYCFFSHTIKGQEHNMPMLKRMLDLRNTLIDYECIQDEAGRRLVFFGQFAGYAGMIDSLWTLGLRLTAQGVVNPFSAVKQAVHYDTLAEVRREFKQLAEIIRQDGLPGSMVPFVCGFTGYGNVSRGAQEIFNILPHSEIKASELKSFMENGQFSDKQIYKVVFSEKDMFQPIDPGDEFDLDEYYKNPENYQSIFEQYIPYLGMLINGIFWAPHYPRLITREFLKEYFHLNKEMPLMVIGDITCDIDGSIECTVKATNAESPVYIYHPLTGAIQDGFEGEGVAVLAVDKLPSELPKEATEFFGSALQPFIPGLARADFTQPIKNLWIPDTLKHAIIAHQGRLLPTYKYLSDHIK